MSRFSITLFLLLSLLCLQTSYANPTGLLFNVSTTGFVLTINTVKPHHSYPNAGIRIHTGGYSLTNVGTECQPNNSGYCLFAVSDTQPAIITLDGPNGTVDISLCLNGIGALSCQHYFVNLEIFTI